MCNAQMVAGKDAARPGEAKNSWLTGTASWNYYTITQYILGIRTDYNGLVIDPCIPAEWEGFKVSRKFRGAIYNIEVVNPESVSKGVKQVFIDGEENKMGNLVPVMPVGTYHVKVILGS